MHPFLRILDVGEAVWTRMKRYIDDRPHDSPGRSDACRVPPKTPPEVLLLKCRLDGETYARAQLAALAQRPTSVYVYQGIEFRLKL